MKKIRSYTSIWSVEKILYAISNVSLLFPMTYMQIVYFVISLMIVIVFKNVPPFSLIDGAFLKYLGIPVAVTWFMSQKTFDGKRPYNFVKSVALYFCRPKLKYAGKVIRLRKKRVNESITVVRSEKYGISD